ncbi:hypothetical protein B5X24_HaOG213480 [Helicoverpa armigera]|uniref:Uncharacterized protein n=1 Tax=Helicoverpa armigera TaxID=29058 RepID=A0A2W1BDM3_HELAM|nr:hypothetical protein B5X24_HaOG213480 [Helicoverpa armigera]
MTHAHANSDNTRHGQVKRAESSKLHSSPAVATTSDASPCPTLPESPAFGTPTSKSKKFMPFKLKHIPVKYYLIKINITTSERLLNFY